LPHVVDLKAASVRIWRAADQFIESRTRRFAPLAAAVLNAEGREVARAFTTYATADAALSAVDDTQWFTYLSRVWMSIVPDATEFTEDVMTKPAQKAAPKPRKRPERVEDEARDVGTLAAREWLRQNGAQEAGKIANVSRKEIAGVIRSAAADGQDNAAIAKSIVEHYQRNRQNRSTTIARTETHAATNYGTLAGAVVAREPMRKIWITQADDRVRDTHTEAAGQTRTLDEAFLVSSERLMYPGDSSLGAGPELTINCRCVLGYMRVPARVPARPTRSRRG
jgi:hypothetical protein